MKRQPEIIDVEFKEIRDWQPKPWLIAVWILALIISFKLLG